MSARRSCRRYFLRSVRPNRAIVYVVGFDFACCWRGRCGLRSGLVGIRLRDGRDVVHVLRVPRNLVMHIVVAPLLLHGVVLDAFIYPPDQFLSEYDPAEFAQVWDGKIILDKNGMGGWLKKNVLDYIEHIPLKTAKDVSQEIKWCEKMLLRTMRGDVEGYYRWHWLLCDSLEIYFDIKGIHYYGPKKALHFMEESDSEAFHIYSKALLEFNQEGLSDWINYLKTIF